jgi:hypothetical protein
LIVIPFRRIIGSPHLFGATSVIWGADGVVRDPPGARHPGLQKNQNPRKLISIKGRGFQLVNPDADKIEEIIDRAHSYEIYEEGIGRYRFVDRDNEIRKILKSSEHLFLAGRITVLYGSKGCGKSTLFEA